MRQKNQPDKYLSESKLHEKSYNIWQIFITSGCSVSRKILNRTRQEPNQASLKGMPLKNHLKYYINKKRHEAGKNRETLINKGIDQNLHERYTTSSALNAFRLMILCNTQIRFHTVHT